MILVGLLSGGGGGAVEDSGVGIGRGDMGSGGSVEGDIREDGVLRFILVGVLVLFCGDWWLAGVFSTCGC